jgi:hypothetical protein
MWRCFGGLRRLKHPHPSADRVIFDLNDAPMNTVLQQIINILVIPPGNLIYHLVLAFSVAGALQIAVSSTPRFANQTPRRRMLFGLLLLLALRLGLFVAAGAGWQGLVNERQLLPPLDRLSTLLGMVVLLWLWVFPRPTRLGDASTALLGLLALTGSLLALVWWNGQGLQESFNNSWTAFGLDIFALALAGLGALLLGLRRPAGWEWGLAMCALLAVGHALQLYTGDLQSDYPALVRLAQLTAFPLLLLLPGRLASDKSTPREMEPNTALEPAASEAQIPVADAPQRLLNDRRDPLAAAELLQAALELGTESEPEKARQAITRAVSHAFLTDICLLFTPPGAHGSMTLLAGYDLIRACPIAPAQLTSSTIPVIASSFRRGRSVRLPFNSASPDLTGLAELLGHESLARSNSAHHIASQVRPLLSPGVPFYSVRMHDQTMPFYLQRTLTLVDYRDEFDYGLQQEPTLAVDSLETFKSRWLADADAFALMVQDNYDLLAKEGLPMTLVARDTRRIIVRKPR